MKTHAPPAQSAPKARHARTVLPAEVHARLCHLALDLGCSHAELLVDGAILVCRYHSQGGGFTRAHAADGEGRQLRTRRSCTMSAANIAGKVPSCTRTTIETTRDGWPLLASVRTVRVYTHALDL
jgi:hypothetical protein